jgi:predicted PurR-regulated permease PerM
VQTSYFPFPRDPKWQRVLAVAAFFLVLHQFRSLAPVLVFFVVFERALGGLSGYVSRWTKLSPTASIASILVALFAGLGLATFLGIRKLLAFVEVARSEGPAWVASLSRSGLVEKAKQHLGVDAHGLTASASDYAMRAIGYVSATAYAAIYVFLGFVLAVMYLFERETLDAWTGSLSRTSLAGTLMRWIGYVADSIAITVRLQIVVALFNAVFTLPLLLLLGLPNVPVLFLLMLLGGMIPVVGGAASGLVLALVAYDAKGVVGVAVFLGVTAVLGKVESYYLSPRLTAEHVKLPGLVLVVSLLMFETIFGFWGLFLSFPALYVAHRVINEWRESTPTALSTGPSTPSETALVAPSVARSDALPSGALPPEPLPPDA